jgi:hypothetical protein
MLSSILSLGALLTPVLAAAEPVNTAILGPYGNVPPVYPSREPEFTLIPCLILTLTKQISLALVAGLTLLSRPKHSLLN